MPPGVDVPSGELSDSGMTIPESPARRNHRPNQRELICKAHLKQLIQGNGKKYYLHLLQPDQLQQQKQ